MREVTDKAREYFEKTSVMLNGRPIKEVVFTKDGEMEISVGDNETIKIDKFGFVESLYYTINIHHFKNFNEVGSSDIFKSNYNKLIKHYQRGEK